MKKLILNLLLVTGFIFVISCNEESDKITPQISQPSPKPIAFGKLEKAYTSSKNLRTTNNGVPTWLNDPGDGDSFFYQDGNTVSEERDGSVVFTFTVWSEGNNFLYIKDGSRNFNLALPIWNPGKFARASYWDNNQKKWIQWRQFKYTVLFGNACDNDSEPPEVSKTSCGLINPISLFCKTLTSSVSSFPTTLADNRNYLISELGLSDNCDEYLTIRQNPAPGTVIDQPKTISVSYEAIDNQGNALRFFHLQTFQVK